MIDPIRRIDPVGAPGQPASPGTKPAGTSFGDVLADRLTGAGQLRFSGHALDRIKRRGIELDQAALGRLQDGVARVAAKGARDSLVLVDGTAFVVAVPSRTVITAVDSEHMREHVFTNIDSAVIA
jgi:flagellar operon protein